MAWLSELFNREVSYLYYKKIDTKYYGLCGVNISYKKHEDPMDICNRIGVDVSMSILGYKPCTENEYNRFNKQ